MNSPDKKRTYFIDGFRAKKVNGDFEKLTQLILLEEFSRCVDKDTQLYLDEKDITNINDAAILADTHKVTLRKRYEKTNLSHKHLDGYSYNKSSIRSQTHNFSRNNNIHNRQNPFPTDSIVKCTYCGRRNHLISECRIRKRDNESNRNYKPHAFANTRKINSFPHSSLQSSNEFKNNTDSIMQTYKPFLSDGCVSTGDIKNTTPIQILRDTGASQTLLQKDILHLSNSTFTGEYVLLQGIDLNSTKIPLHKIYLQSSYINGFVVVGVLSTLPVKGVSLILGNDLANGKVITNPIITDNIDLTDTNEEDNNLYPICVLTRARKNKQLLENHNTSLQDTLLKLNETFIAHDLEKLNNKNKHLDISTVRNGNTTGEIQNNLIKEQQNDNEICLLKNKALPLEDAEKERECFYMTYGILMRKWRPLDASLTEEWRIIHQIVIPKVYREEILNIAHNTPMSGHLGINKTHDKILQHFYWPKLKQDVIAFCNSCHTCQMVGKPNQKIPPAPLKPIPAFGEPFSRVLVDCVGPLPKTKTGNIYLLTIMCASTRFPEAIPLRNIKTRTIVKALTKFFCLVGIPSSIQSDQGSNFMSSLFKQVMDEMSITQYRSSSYHPESQRALERFHQTLKSMIQKFCFEYQKDWDDGVHFCSQQEKQSKNRLVLVRLNSFSVIQ